MKKLAVSKASEPLSDYVRQVDEGPVLVLTERGKPIAALISMRNLDPESLALSMNSRFMEIIERSRRRHEREGGISSDEMRRRLGLPPKRSRRKS